MSSHHAGLNPDDFREFAVRQRVVVREGFIGTIVDVDDAPPGMESYTVVLDDNQGQGEWGVRELSPITTKEAALASEDYPELEEVLVERQPLARIFASDDYQMRHRPDGPGEDTGATMDRMRETFPDDVYEHPEYYGSRPWVTEAGRVLRTADGNPNAQITLYRACPPDATSINRGDWVTTVRSYAQQHLESNGEPDWHIISIVAPAKYIYSGGNDIIEWGYWGPDAAARKVASVTAAVDTVLYRGMSVERADLAAIARGLGQSVGIWWTPDRQYATDMAYEGLESTDGEKWDDGYVSVLVQATVDGEPSEDTDGDGYNLQYPSGAAVHIQDAWYAFGPYDNWKKLPGVPSLSKTAATNETIRLWRGLDMGTVTESEYNHIRSNPSSYVREALTTNGVGIHWTDDPESAWNFSQGRDPDGWASESFGGDEDEEGSWSVGIVIEAEVPVHHTLDRNSKEFEDYALGEAILDYSIEREVTVRDGAALTITDAIVTFGNDDGVTGEVKAGGGFHVTAAENQTIHDGVNINYQLKNRETGQTSGDYGEMGAAARADAEKKNSADYEIVPVVKPLREKPKRTMEGARKEGGWVVVDKARNVKGGPFDNKNDAELLKDQLDPEGEALDIDQENTSLGIGSEGWGASGGEPEVHYNFAASLHEVPVTIHEAGWLTDKLNDIGGGEGHAPSFDWCAYRHNSRCFYPRNLDPEATNEAGYPVWIPVDRGYCGRSNWDDQIACPVSKPGPHSGDPQAVAETWKSYRDGGQRGYAASLHAEAAGKVRTIWRALHMDGVTCTAAALDPEAQDAIERWQGAYGGIMDPHRLEDAYSDSPSERGQRIRQALDAARGPVGPMRLYRGERDQDGMVGEGPRRLRSWTTDRAIARQWVDDDSQVLERVVPADEIVYVIGGPQSEVIVRTSSINPVEFLPTVGIVEGQRLYRGQHIDTTNHDRSYPRATPHASFLKRLQAEPKAVVADILDQVGNNWTPNEDVANRFGNPGGDPYHEWVVLELEGWKWSDLPDEWADPSALDMRPWDQEQEIRFKPGWRPRPDQIKAVRVRRDAYDGGVRVTAGRYNGNRGPIAITYTEGGEVGNHTHITREDQGMVPIELIEYMPGQNGERPGEHRNRHDAEWEEFKADIAKNGLNWPIFIAVDYGKPPTIYEGNHRRDALVENGATEALVTIRYFGHAEQTSALAKFAEMNPRVGSYDEPEDEEPHNYYEVMHDLLPEREEPDDRDEREVDPVWGGDERAYYAMRSAWKGNLICPACSAGSWDEEQCLACGHTKTASLAEETLGHEDLMATPKGDFTHVGLMVKARSSGRVLLTQRTPDSNDDEDTYGRWEFPGGGIDDGETPWESVLREFSEETGLDLPSEHRIEEVVPSDHYCAFLVIVPDEAWVHEARFDPFETMGIGWFDPEELEASDNLLRGEVQNSDWGMIKEALKTAASTYYHGTNAELASGETLHPAAFSGHGAQWDSIWYDSSYVYMTTNLLAAERFAWLAVKHHGGSPHIYEVRATGVMPDPEQFDEELGGFAKDNFVAHVATVVGEVDLPGHVHYDGEGFMRGPAKTATYGLTDDVQGWLHPDGTFERVPEHRNYTQHFHAGCVRITYGYQVLSMEKESLKELTSAQVRWLLSLWEEAPLDVAYVEISAVDSADNHLPVSSLTYRDRLAYNRAVRTMAEGLTPKEGALHVASWDDVVKKATILRREGGVRIISVNGDQITAEVRGDTGVYQTGLLREPGTKRVAMWECGCKWAMYSWGRSGRWKKYEGRMCAHALALMFQAQSEEFGGGQLIEQHESPWPGEKVQTPDAAKMQPGAWRLANLRSGFKARIRGLLVTVTNIRGSIAELVDGTDVSASEVIHPEYDPRAGLGFRSTASLDLSKVAAANKFPGDCFDCGRRVGVGDGVVTRNANDTGWETRCVDCRDAREIAKKRRMPALGEEVDILVVRGGNSRRVKGVVEQVFPAYNNFFVLTNSNTVEKVNLGNVQSGLGKESAMSMWDDPIVEQPLQVEASVAPPLDDDAMLFEAVAGDEVMDPAFVRTVNARWTEGASSMVHDEPEPALPSTDGAIADDEDTIAGPAGEGLMNTASRNWLMNGAGPSSGGEHDNIAAMAQQFLKTGAKTFSVAEQQQIIDEPRSGARASNLDRLQLEGTHYPQPGSDMNIDDDELLWT